ncbi:hypothetical protein AB0950_34380 [Streptomyces sp. NPDC007189]|uniref:hypothetical protein n=1 Tax=Streptomyces sp. NPDC007189 TaxID=3154315 RepID=UPI003455C88F
MTTPSPTTHPAHPHPAPQSPPPRSRRRSAVGLVAAPMVLVCAVVAVRSSGDGDSRPLEGRPRVTDTRAGLSYAVPEGWTHDPAKDKDLIDAFTSRIGTAGSGGPGPGGGSVVAGRAGQPVARADLPRATETAARSNAEFFFPDRPASVEESRDTVVDGQPAHTTVLRVAGEEGTARVEMTLITVHGERTSFLLGVTTGTEDPQVTADIEAVVGSTTAS